MLSEHPLAWGAVQYYPGGQGSRTLMMMYWVPEHVLAAVMYCSSNQLYEEAGVAVRGRQWSNCRTRHVWCTTCGGAGTELA
mmetsp:Transcript_33289/g.73623  ORF Transcript_33289/g.73623 Transcript_33289/m.73623 type:complete len:81 (-) Transcript_33289:466-708(-)